MVHCYKGNNVRAPLCHHQCTWASVSSSHKTRWKRSKNRTIFPSMNCWLASKCSCQKPKNTQSIKPNVLLHSSCLKFELQIEHDNTKTLLLQHKNKARTDHIILPFMSGNQVMNHVTPWSELITLLKWSSEQLVSPSYSANVHYGPQLTYCHPDPIFHRNQKNYKHNLPTKWRLSLKKIDIAPPNILVASHLQYFNPVTSSNQAYLEGRLTSYNLEFQHCCYIFFSNTHGWWWFLSQSLHEINLMFKMQFKANLKDARIMAKKPNPQCDAINPAQCIIFVQIEVSFVDGWLLDSI